MSSNQWLIIKVLCGRFTTSIYAGVKSTTYFVVDWSTGRLWSRNKTSQTLDRCRQDHPVVWRHQLQHLDSHAQITISALTENWTHNPLIRAHTNMHTYFCGLFTLVIFNRGKKTRNHVLALPSWSVLKWHFSTLTCFLFLKCIYGGPEFNLGAKTLCG